MLALLVAAAFAGDFGHTGQYLVMGSASVSYSSTGSDSVTSLDVSPEVAGFIADHWALGLSLHYTLTSATVNGVDQGTRTSGGISPYVAYDMPLGSQVSLFPSAGLLFTSQADRRTWGLTAFVPFLFHPVAHFFLGLGPSIAADLVAQVPGNGPTPTSNSDRTFTLGARTVLGGYF
ncbi:MAG TPA: hypothetical protein VLW85_09100 [Myxococcales bacterium]|nr:hypothetical protein [Myxococcales bacterium]